MPVIALKLASKSLKKDVTSLLALARASRATFVTAHHNCRRSFHLGLPTTHFNRTSQPDRTQNPRTWDILPNVRAISTEYPYLIFYSTSNNPYHNLAIENFLLRNSDHGSHILLFYVNRPCVVIGRNQNPWLECDIARVREGLPWKETDWDLPANGNNAKNTSLDVIRRRSGGGTVVHDVGNLNFSVIVPNDKDFTRVKHAEMVVRAVMNQSFTEAIDSAGPQDAKGSRLYERVRVNERHDIVMSRKSGDEGDEKKEFKVTGSAYKLTRGRAMHHGTLLHSSPNVAYSSTKSSHTILGTFLHSPGKGFIEAKGVGSVPSPVHNLFSLASSPSRENVERNRLRAEIVRSIAREFWELYSPNYNPLEFEVGDVDCQEQTNADIAKDAQELMTDEWRFEQTPQFEFHSVERNAEVNDRESELSFQVKNGTVHSLEWTGDVEIPISGLDGKKLHQISNWGEFFDRFPNDSRRQLVAKLSSVFPPIALSNFNSSDLMSGTGHERRAKSNTDERTIQREGDLTFQREKEHRTVEEIERKGQNLIEDKPAQKTKD